MNGFEIAIERLPRADFGIVSGMILRRDLRRIPLCYQCEQPADMLFADGGVALCGPCRVISRLRAK